MSAPVIDPVSAPQAPARGRTAKAARTTPARFDTALGWNDRPGVAWALRILLCLIALGVFAAPFLTIFAGAFSKNPSGSDLSFLPHHPTLLNFKVANERSIWDYFTNSLVIAGGALLLQLAVSVLAAYALARHKFRGQALVLTLFMLTMMLPEEVIAIPLSLVLGHVPVLGIDLKGTAFGVILPLGAWGFSIMLLTEFMKDIPIEIEEAARLDGVGEFRMLWQVVLPLCKPALGVAGVLGFVMIWDQYLLPLIASKDPSDYTVTVALSVLRTDPEVGSGVLLAGAVIALVPSLIVYLLLQRSLVTGIAAGATKG
ncbi:carbohydrate ABC transporter permease [Streptomyces acidiscabies]|uniref:Carbohydrate ABC transporter permease n=1 Tax=Streptomyces acidiscabies TaxID=42234 RepID=A0AAP6B5Q7_9ACTN|nr:carbohydrate ABC transporter permease [Streptomyces acidiscabies]MBP5941599.1 carbohydrate ABC transporter permease [Streptomyces sp. LBUM 1476]MBZ3912992.1 carbohydrate ABC transporter permease [Streptomyces acidiscabies]MDX2958477.1 carbohydrate ABC transporter permease [Streptomyces acidiscabies]MDX3021017.1 carbohydrate ABC transporter permease [Streptomyces acidiscabies]MDX3794980.1 carbohydrate ABC transporter permease [Streptomyces acidiscabies]